MPHTIRAHTDLHGKATRHRPALMRLAGLAIATAVVLAGATAMGARGGGDGQGILPPAKTVRLTPAEAAKLAKEARASVPAKIVDGLELTLWAPAQLVADPLAIDIDSNGVAYVGASPRSGQLLDIREHPDWVPEVHTMRTTEDLRQFFRRVMAPERSAQNGWLPDANNDGSHDWRDLTAFKERIYRLEDTNGDGIADLSEVVFEGFNEDIAADILGGILVHGGDVYATMAPDVWRLRDTNGDHTLDVKESLSHGYSIHPAFSGHDLSALTVGPDGRIYWKIGDIGMNVVDKTGRRWAFPNRGAVLRADPDGTNFEVFATGIRNTQEMAFDEHGNLVSVDNDGDYPGETERVVYITQGSDTGWRSTWQYGKYTDPNNNRYNVWMDEGLFKPKFDGQPAYIVPPIAPYHAGPSGFAYNPGTALADRWRGHFFVTSFTGSPSGAKVYAFTLKERGAGFSLGTDTELLDGVLSPGMRIGPDGAMYLTDWITGWGAPGSGRVWKLDAPGAASTAVRKDVRTLLAADLKLRPIASVRSLLAHADMRVRLKAQFELARRKDAAGLAALAGAGGQQLSRIHAIWGLGQIARADATQASKILPLLRDTDAEIRAQAAKTLGDVRTQSAAAGLLPLLKDPAARPRFFAAEALGRLGYQPAVAPLVGMLADNDDRDEYLRSAGASALANIGNASALVALSTHPSRAVRLAAVVALRRLHEAAVAQFLNDADEAVVTEAARAINDEGSIETAVSQLALVLGHERFKSEALLRRAINANFRVGTPEAARRVAAVAAKPGMLPAVRVEAVAALAAWPTPSTMDRVDGAYLGGTQQRDATAAREAATGLIPMLDLPETPVPMRVAIVEAADRLAIAQALPQLTARLRTDPAPEVRIAALRALQKLSPDVEATMRTALADADATVRREAITLVPSLRVSNAAKGEYLAGVLKSGSNAEKQTALGLVGSLQGVDPAQLLTGLLDELSAGKAAPEIQLDLVEAVQAAKSEPLLARLDRTGLSRALDNLASVFPEALQRGGNANRGVEVVFGHPAAQCMRCHTLGSTEGATVGPNLTKVGGQLTRPQILQALVDPSARIAPGFGAVTLRLKSGQTIAGTLRDENAQSLLVETSSGNQRVPVADVAERTNAPSAMPPMGAILRPREIRDVVEFLGSLR